MQYGMKKRGYCTFSTRAGLEFWFCDREKR
jgi:hypothetical protein